MTFSRSKAAPVETAAQHTSRLPLKILIAGGFGVGKTTFVQAISEIMPLTTEAPITAASIGLDNLADVPNKRTTTVAMDFGRIRLGSSRLLYLFGTPGQDRFWFMWDELITGAVGAVVLVDTRRLDDCFGALDYFESRLLPYVVAVNQFSGAEQHPVDDVREALTLAPEVPLVLMDARDRSSVRETLVALARHALAESVEAGR